MVQDLDIQDEGVPQGTVQQEIERRIEAEFGQTQRRVLALEAVQQHDRHEYNWVEDNQLEDDRLGAAADKDNRTAQEEEEVG